MSETTFTLTSLDTPVNGGLTPRQVRALSAPINGNAVRVHPYHKWAYVPGVIVVNNLNKAFGFDGWSSEIIELLQEQPQAFEGKGGKQQFRVMVSIRVRLHIHTPGGRTFYRDGVGADEKVSANLIDCVDNAQASAYTYALRSAAILLGQQFGLAVMRAGKDIKWQDLCVGNDPDWPDFGSGVGQPDHALTEAANDIGEDGHQITARQDQGQQQAPQQTPQQTPQQAPQQAQPSNYQQPAAAPTQPAAAPPQQAPSQQPAPAQQPQGQDQGGWGATPNWDARRPPEQQQAKPAAQPAAAPQQQPAAQAAPAAQPQGHAAAAPQQQAAPSGGPPPGYDRQSTVDQIRAIWKDIGTTNAAPILRNVCKANGLSEATPPMMVGRPPENGGLPDPVLVALLQAFQQAKGA